MTPGNEPAAALVDSKIDVKIKLAALWASTMFCYVYGDFFGLFAPGRLTSMLAGKMGPLGQVTQGVLLGVSIFMAIPSLMIFLSVFLKPGINRWLNIVVGLLFTVIVLLTIPGAWNFYIFFSLLEAVLTLLVVWFAWTWPRQPTQARVRPT